MLEGTLATFTLPDVLRLLALTDKTGCLRLQAEGSHGRIWVEDGGIVHAVGRTGRLPLTRRLVGGGLVPTGALRRALAEAPETATAAGRDLAVAGRLTGGGATSPDTLRRLQREQVQDAVFELMRWSAGTFGFVSQGPTARLDDAPAPGPDVDTLLAEASRRLGVWREISAVVPGRDAVVGVAPADDRPAAKVDLTAAQLRLVAALDGQRTVGELIELSGRGEFATCRMLHELASAGLLVVSRPDAAGSLPPGTGAVATQQQLLRDHEEEAGAPSAAQPTAPHLSLVEPTDPDGGAGEPVPAAPAGAQPAGRLETDPRATAEVLDELIAALDGPAGDDADAGAAA